MRLAETTRVLSLCLVSACWTDLGDAGERAAGYYARPWDWAAIRRNAGSIHQWHGDDDPFIPLAEARHVAENLDSAYAELPGRSHFFAAFPSSRRRRAAAGRHRPANQSWRERAGLVDRRELDARPREGPGDGRDGRRVEPGARGAPWRPARRVEDGASPVDDGAAT
ncbi:hypothetical protein JL721_9321 [Aureococcus anophagefferens]|nr:hypothetical protein JL721_9321 [Aureococcus anophagefferens]